jgi:hypothetical protein
MEAAGVVALVLKMLNSIGAGSLCCKQQWDRPPAFLQDDRATLATPPFADVNAPCQLTSYNLCVATALCDHRVCLCMPAVSLQLPWHLCLQAGQQQYALSTAVDAATAASSSESTTISSGGSSSTSPVQHTPVQQQQAALNFTEGPQQLQEAAAAAAGLHDPSTPLQQQQQQQQQQGRPPRSPLTVGISYAPAGSFRLPPNTTLQDLAPDESCSTPAVLQQLLAQICTRPHNAPLTPFQINPAVDLQLLEQQERLCLRGQRGFRFLDEAYIVLNSMLNSFVKSPRLREAARGAHIPKAVSHDGAGLVICCQCLL